MQPDPSGPVAIVRAALAQGRSRLLIRDVFLGVAIAALVVGAGVALAPSSAGEPLFPLAVAIAIAGTIVAIRRRARTAGHVAVLIERADPALKNVIITAEELLRHPERSSDWIGRRVFADGAHRLASVDLRSIVPIGRAGAAAGAVLFMASLMPLAVRTIDRGAGGTGLAVGHSARTGLVVTIRLEPPAYSPRPSAALTNPTRVDALQGTRLFLVATGAPGVARVRFGDRQLTVTQREDGSATEMVLLESGYLAVELVDAAMSEPSRLIAVTVTPDRAPTVRVERPGRDLLLPDVRAVVEIDATASDDIGLDALALKYTRVSGSGEQFAFVEGELPLEVSKADARTWRARGRIPIAGLGLEPGDSLVYRLTARDGRPGAAGSSSSDTFFVEIAGPGQVALEGFEMPPEQERYALSQQMIVVKLRRLRAGEKGMSPTALDEQTSAIAAEQRAVRGNFVFLMGGHVEDEEEEAEQSHEIQEGRLENTARREIWRAISHMTSTEQALAAHDTRAALAAAVRAVESLQRAFTRNRYILRTLPSRLRIDPSRRLSGALDDVTDGERPTPNAAESPDALLARQLLAETLALIPRLRSEPGSAPLVAALSTAAERALSAAARDAEWSAIAQSVLRLRDAVSAGSPPTRIDAESGAVVAALLQRIRHHAAKVGRGRADHLESAWADEARRR